MAKRTSTLILAAILLVAAIAPASAIVCSNTEGNSIVVVGDEIVAGETYSHRFGGNLFLLVPHESGWDVAVRDANGYPLVLFTPASGIAQDATRAILAEQFRDSGTGANIMTGMRPRRFAFGADARNPELHPELNIVPGGVPAAPALPPRFGRGEIEIVNYDLAGIDAGETPYLARLRFNACLEWTADTANVPPADDSAGLDPEERMLDQAVAEFAAIADIVGALHGGEIDGDMALARIEALRERIIGIRARWREADPQERRLARESRLHEIETVERRLNDAIAEFSSRPRDDYRVLHVFNDPPMIGDFLREPPIQTFQGIYRSGFEANDFYLFNGEGPWWLEAETMSWEQLQSHMVQRPGRGSSVTVSLTVRGWIESEGGYGQLGNYGTRIYVESIEQVRPITQDEFWAAVGARQ